MAQALETLFDKDNPLREAFDVSPWDDPTNLYDWLTQYQSSPESPIRELMKEVLRNAVGDLFLKRHRDDARKWILKSNGNYLFSFPTICDHLGFDVEILRRNILALNAKPSCHRFIKSCSILKKS